MVAGLDVVIRIAAASGGSIERSVFSAALQDHRPVTIRIDGAHGAAALAPILALVPEVRVVGAEEARLGRYLAMMDAGDVVYPEGWRRLIAELEASGAALALGGMLAAEVDHTGLVLFTRSKRPSASQVFVVDCTRIGADMLTADEGLLPRLRTRVATSTALAATVLGEHEA